MHEIILKKNILKEDYQKILKRLNLFFLSNPVLFNRHDCERNTEKEPETSD